MSVISRRIPYRWFAINSTKYLCTALRCKHDDPHASSPYFQANDHKGRAHGYVPTLSRQQISTILEQGEMSVDMSSDSIKGFESNQLASNTPIEDRRAQAEFIHSSGCVFGVFDGHAGPACAQSISERLLEYIAVSLMPHDVLERIGRNMRADHSTVKLLHHYHHDMHYHSSELASTYRASLSRYIVETLSSSGLEDFYMADALHDAISRLDHDIISEGLPSSGILNVEALNIAMSGACACISHIDGQHLHVANVGDTKAVLGSQGEGGQWIAKPLTIEHNCENPEEVKRIYSEHPLSEKPFILRNNRLLGQLVPLRAFGDVRYKWSLSDLKKIVKILNTSYAENIIPPNCYTPPYLTSRPEITYHRLGSRDKFLVLASDGLWDMLGPEMVVKLVGEHMQGKQTMDEFQPPEDDFTLGNINNLLKHRKTSLAKRAIDQNVATHLIRNALGLEHTKVSQLLTLPEDIVREYRDDITVTVVYFDTEYLRNCPRT